MLKIKPTMALFQSTPPARGATIEIHTTSPPQNISIHAPREGGDMTSSFYLHFIEISIHAPREGGDRVSRLFDKLR